MKKPGLNKDADYLYILIVNLVITYNSNENLRYKSEGVGPLYH